MGPTGPTGPDGPAGPPGSTGTPGLPGDDGMNGMNGMNGMPGDNGVPGTAGPDGENGMNGVTGAPGEPGQDSTASPNAAIAEGGDGGDGGDGGRSLNLTSVPIGPPTSNGVGHSAGRISFDEFAFTSLIVSRMFAFEDVGCRRRSARKDASPAFGKTSQLEPWYQASRYVSEKLRIFTKYISITPGPTGNWFQSICPSNPKMTQNTNFDQS